MIIAQNIGEYGGLAGLAASFQRLWYQAETALQDPSVSVPVGCAVVVVAYFLLRRR